MSLRMLLVATPDVRGQFLNLSAER